MLRAMVKTFARRSTGAEADAGVRGALWPAQRGPGQLPQRVPGPAVGHPDGHDRAGDPAAADRQLLPGLAAGSAPLVRQALVSVVATSYLLGVSTRRVEKLADTLGIKSLSKSQVSQLAKSLDGAVEQFRSRPLDAGPYRFIQADALTLRVREGGRTVLVHGLIATGVNADGHRGDPGFDVTSAEDGAGWLAFFRGLVARGLAGVVLVTSDAHAGLVGAIQATLPGASWQRCRTHYLRDLLTKVAKTSQPWVATLVRTIFDQPDAAKVAALVTGPSTR